MTTATLSLTERMARRDAAVASALDEYVVEINRHGHVYGSPVSTGDVVDLIAAYATPSTPRCQCGEEFRTNRSVGMHVAAAEKRASKIYDAAVKAAIAEARP